MPKDMSSNSRVEIPGGDFIATARMTRDGSDLHLTSPDGHNVVISGYFAQSPSPDLVSNDGARLSPQLVSSFLIPDHIGQYAASGQMMNDASPSGKVSNVAGEAHILRADGSQVPAAIGTLVYQGDVIETSKTGAVNILFADNTAFAVGENARMAIDKYNYDAEHHSGSSFLSMLQGVFVYTSGLIGKADPGNVSVETPVGTIGIRGTAVAGDLHAGKSVLSIWEGAISVTNDTGTTDMRHRFTEFSFKDYQHAPIPLPDMDPLRFMHDHKVLFSVFDPPWFRDLLDQLHGVHTQHQGLLLMPEFMHPGHDMSWKHSDDSNDSSASGIPLPVYDAPAHTAAASETRILSVPNLNNIFYIGPAIPSPLDGGAGYDTLYLTRPGKPFNLDFTAVPAGTLKNMEAIDLGNVSGHGNNARLNVDSVFNMTDRDHILHVFVEPDAIESKLAVVVSNIGTPGFNLISAVDNGTMTTTTFTGDHAGHTVTLVVNSMDVTPGHAGGHVAILMV